MYILSFLSKAIFFSLKVVEYSEITKESAEKRNPDGSLTYSAANICIHYFTRKFLDHVVGEHERDLVHHVAKKNQFLFMFTNNAIQ